MEDPPILNKTFRFAIGQCQVYNFLSVSCDKSRFISDILYSKVFRQYAIKKFISPGVTFYAPPDSIL